MFVNLCLWLIRSASNGIENYDTWLYDKVALGITSGQGSGRPDKTYHMSDIVGASQ